jgi:hypothetical protein
MLMLMAWPFKEFVSEMIVGFSLTYEQISNFVEEGVLYTLYLFIYFLKWELSV